MALYEFELRLQAIAPEPVGIEAHPQVVSDALYAAVDAFDAAVRAVGLQVASKGYGVLRDRSQDTPAPAAAPAPYCYICNDYHEGAAVVHEGRLTQPCAASPADVDWNTPGADYGAGRALEEGPG